MLRSSAGSLIVVASFAASVGFAGQSAPVGSEFQINGDTGGSESTPVVDTNDGGGFIVLWHDFRLVHGEPFDPGVPSNYIIGRQFDAAGGALGLDFTVDGHWGGPHASDPGLVVRSDGTFVTTDHFSLSGGPAGVVVGQLWASSGARTGYGFAANTNTGNLQGTSVATDSAGEFVVVWSRGGQGTGDGDGYGVFGQRFDPLAARLGSEFQINAHTTGDQTRARVAMDSGGRFVVIWTGGDSEDGSSTGIFAQRFDSTGDALGSEFQVNTYTTSDQNSASIAMSSGGDFVIVWTDYGGEDGSSAGIFGQRFDANGAHVGEEFQVNTYTTGDQRHPSVTADANGNFVVVWDSDGQDGNSRGVFAQQFDSTGAPVGTEFQVNTYTTNAQDNPAVAMASGGRYVVTWISAGQNGAASVFGQQFGPPLTLDRSALQFGVAKNVLTTHVTPPQAVGLTAPGSWTATSDQSFVTVTPSGSGAGLLTVQLASGADLPTSDASAKITVTAAGATNSPQTITVNVHVYASGTTIGPFGSFDTPTNGATGVAGAIPVTGWALDDIGVTNVKLYRDPVSADPPGAITANGKVFIADAVFVADVRPDVAALYATLPLNYRAAWGYMLLTNFLPSGSSPVGGNGPFTLYAYAIDVEGFQILLGSKTITVDNANATKPFGTIDTPAQGAVVSGNLDNFGWVLTPGTAAIPTDGSTIHVFVDGVQLGTAQYNLPRSDVQTAFPGYTNSGGPIGYFPINTTTLSNGVHTIFWVVTDNQNRSDGIGSRFFTVLN
jgi:hypothetical protein